ncbi:hypothetical protein GMNKNHGO_00093 [Enterococcus phage vB_Efa29212_3e]|uniref:Uncharacterized protein n=1 Tax=Enterococcus phage vB_Efa29212_3e TaxID=2982224 RepID=A0A978AC82_9CAUD|nr:hypothetical protein GMNKNHGO_00093 [Enterococcus phage vB_Efa29212_3e]
MKLKDLIKLMKPGVDVLITYPTVGATITVRTKIGSNNEVLEPYLDYEIVNVSKTNHYIAIDII